MNKLETDYPCNLKFWLKPFHHYLSIYEKKSSLKRLDWIERESLALIDSIYMYGLYTRNTGI